MKLSKGLFFFMVLVFVFYGTLFGCTKEEQKGNQEKETVGDVSTSPDGRKMEGNMYLKGLPIVKEKTTIKIMVPGPEKDPAEMVFFKRLEEKTNVSVEWEVFPYAQANEKKNLMFATGPYPDAMGGWFLSDKDIMTYGSQGVLIPLEKLIDSYGENINKAFGIWPEVRDVLTTPDGHIYSLPIAAKQPLTKGVMYINKKWLEKLNLPMPTTTEEYYQVLKAFKENDPNGNGKPDEIPLSYRLGGNDEPYGLFGSFGRVDNWGRKVLENGKVVFTAVHQEYKNAIKYLNKLYSEGLLDPEAITQDYQQYVAKARQEPAVLGSFFAWESHALCTARIAEENFLLLPPLKGEKGHQMWPQGDPSIFRTQFAVTSEAKNPEVVVRWVDQFFDPDTSVEVARGPFGVTIEKQSDGTITNLPTPEGMSFDEFRNSETISSFPYLITKEMRDKIEKNVGGIVKENVDKVYEEFIIKEKFPQIWLTPEQQQEADILWTDISKYVGDNQARWIAGDSSIDDDWDKYISELNKMGLPRWIEIQQEAVDSYFSNK